MVCQFVGTVSTITLKSNFVYSRSGRRLALIGTVGMILNRWLVLSVGMCCAVDESLRV